MSFELSVGSPHQKPSQILAIRHDCNTCRLGQLTLLKVPKVSGGPAPARKWHSLLTWWGCWELCKQDIRPTFLRDFIGSIKSALIPYSSLVISESECLKYSSESLGKCFQWCPFTRITDSYWIHVNNCACQWRKNTHWMFLNFRGFR